MKRNVENKKQKSSIKDPKIKLLDNEINSKETKKEFQPDDTEKVLSKYVEKRILEMKEYRKSLKIEQLWKEADKEYIPSDVNDVMKNPRKIFEADQETGLRSRLVNVGAGDDDAWRLAVRVVSRKEQIY